MVQLRINGIFKSMKHGTYSNPGGALGPATKPWKGAITRRHRNFRTFSPSPSSLPLTFPRPLPIPSSLCPLSLSPLLPQLMLASFPQISSPIKLQARPRQFEAYRKDSSSPSSSVRKITARGPDLVTCTSLDQ